MEKTGLDVGVVTVNLSEQSRVGLIQLENSGLPNWLLDRRPS